MTGGRKSARRLAGEGGGSMVQGVRACPRCGSGRLRSLMLLGGPVLTGGERGDLARCLDCGATQVPLLFTHEEERRAFEQERARAESIREAAPAPSPHPGLLPILPVRSSALPEVFEVAEIPERHAQVVSVRWDGEHLVAGDYAVSFTRYWRAVGGPRYSASTLLMLDLSGLLRGRPSFQILRELCAQRCEVWLEMGVRSAQEVMDVFMVGARVALTSTLTAQNLGLFEQIHALTDEAVPCLAFDGELRWQDHREPQSALLPHLRALHTIGYRRAAVLDLRRLGTSSGPDLDLAERLSRAPVELYWGGGVRETDRERLEEVGVRGGLVEPYTPVILDLVQRLEKTEAMPDTTEQLWGVASGRRADRRLPSSRT